MLRPAHRPDQRRARRPCGNSRSGRWRCARRAAVVTAGRSHLKGEQHRPDWPDARDLDVVQQAERRPWHGGPSQGSPARRIRPGPVRRPDTCCEPEAAILRLQSGHHSRISRLAIMSTGEARGWPKERAVEPRP